MTTKSTSQKVKATKVESKKTKALNPKDPKVEEAKVKTSKKVKATKIELPSTKLEKKKSKVAKEVTPVTNTALMEQVVSKREIKYIYPDDCIDTLARKQFRQKVRNKIHKMENQLFKMEDKTSKEYLKISKELKAYYSANVKEGAAI